MSDKDDLADAREQFKLASEHESDNRIAWVEDMRFARLGEQWPEAIRKQRERDGRPCLTINRLPAFMKQVTNEARQNRPAIKCHPVGDGADQDTAEILNGLIRNVEYTSDAEVAYDTALEHAVGGGFGYFRINTRYAYADQFDQDLAIERIANPLCVYGDPNSVAADSSDWNTAFITELLANAEFERRFGKKTDKVDWQGDDKDAAHLWYEEDKTRIAEWWTRDEQETTLLKLSDGTILLAENFEDVREIAAAEGITVIGERPTKIMRVRQRIITGADILETNPWEGRYIPIVPVYGDEVMIEGKRTFVSLVRFSKDPQQMLNYWRSASTELVALAPKAPFIGPVGAFNSDPNWQTANSETHSYLEYDGAVPPQRQMFAGPPAGALQEALNAQDDLKSIMGLYDASLGARSNETSGRAIMARQREGDVSTFNYIDNLSRAIRHAGRILVDMIPKVYQTERIIRVIREDNSVRTVPINRPYDPAQYSQPDDDPANQQQQNAGIMKLHDLTAGKYDVTCQAGPSYTSKREEAAIQMTEFLRAFPAAGPLIGDLYAKNLDWPGADDIAKRLKLMLPPQLQGANPQAQMLQQQLQAQDAQARQAVAQLQQHIGQLQQELAAAKTAAEAERLDKAIEAKKMEIQAYDSETKRLQAAVQAYEAEQAALQSQAAAQQAMQPQPEQQDSRSAVLAILQQLQETIATLAQPRPVTRDEQGFITQM